MVTSNRGTGNERFLQGKSILMRHLDTAVLRQYLRGMDQPFCLKSRAVKFSAKLDFLARTR
jgi:hypothetical protein